MGFGCWGRKEGIRGWRRGLVRPVSIVLLTFLGLLIYILIDIVKVMCGKVL